MPSKKIILLRLREIEKSVEELNKMINEHYDEDIELYLDLTKSKFGEKEC